MSSSIRLHINGAEYEVDAQGRDAQTVLVETRERARQLVAGGGPGMVTFQVRVPGTHEVVDLWVNTDLVTTAMVHAVESPRPYAVMGS